MFRSMIFGLFIVLALMGKVSAVTCYSGDYSFYYCSPGQTCGSYYGDCRGLPAYAIAAIISSGIILLSVCIRICIRLNSNNTPPIPRQVQVQVHSFANNSAIRSPNAVPVHSIREDAPPPYAAVTSSTTGPLKY